MNHYPRHIGDWLRDTAHLSELEECMYSRLIDRYYSSEAPIPLDLTAACRVVRATSRQAKEAVASVLREFFTQQNDGWHQRRCDRELEAYQSRADQARENGKKGGRPKNQTETDPVISGFPETRNPETEQKANQEPIASNQEPVTKNQEKAKSKARHEPAAPFVPPDWVNPEAWQGYIDMRLLKKKPMTSRARDLVIAELDRLRALGHDPNEILDVSTRNDWTDVYAPKAQLRSVAGGLSPVGAQNAQNLAEWLNGTTNERV